MEIALFIILGLALGALIVWLIMRGKLNVVKTILEERTSEGVEFQARLQEREHALTNETEARQQLSVRVEVLTSQLADLQQHSRDALQAKEEAAAQALAAKDAAKADAALVRRMEYPENLGRGKPYPKDE